MISRKNLMLGILVIITALLGPVFSQPNTASQNTRQPSITIPSLVDTTIPYKFTAAPDYDHTTKIPTITRTGTQEVSVRYASNFDISIKPASITLQAGTTGKVDVTTRSAGYAGPVTLSATVSPSASLVPTATIDFSIVTLTAGSNVVSHLTLSSSYKTMVQTYSVTISGTNSSGTTRTASLNLVLTPPPPPDFNIAASPDSMTIISTRSGNSTIIVRSLYNFTGDVQLSITTSDNRLACTLDQQSLTLTDTVQSGSSNLLCKGPEGNYNVTVTGQNTSLSHNAVVRFKIQIFNVSANPATLTILPGETGTSIITVTAKNDFGDTVILEDTVSSQAGLSCSLSTTIVQTAGISTLSCVGSLGTYVVQVTGVSGQVSESTIVTVTVQDFTIQSNPGTVTTNANSNGTSTIAVRALNGFSDNVTLSIASISPGRGMSCVLSQTIIRDGDSDTILSCKGSSGAYTVAVTGTTHSLSHATNVNYSILSKAITQPSNVLAYWPFMAVAALGTAVAAIVLATRKTNKTSSC